MTRPRSPKQTDRRSGAAAVEFIFVMMLVLIPTLYSIWEVGRLVHVQQIVANAAREGARVAAQARTINQVGAPTEIVTSIAPADNTLKQPNMKSAVVQYLHGAGLDTLTWDDVNVAFTFIDSPTGSMAGATEPYQGVQNQKFSVAVSIPFDKVRWTNLGIIGSSSQVSYTAEWRIMVDVPFAVSTNLPNYSGSIP